MNLPPDSPTPDNTDQRLTAVVPDALSGRRVDQALAQIFTDFSRSRLTDWIRAGRVLINGAVCKAKDKVYGGEQVEVDIPPLVQKEYSAEEMELDVLFEDEQLIVINKPAGLVVHPAAGNWEGTLLNGLLNHAPELKEIPRAGIVHRLDKETSGVLVIARTLASHKSLVDQLQTRTMGREYDAVAIGALVSGGTVDAPIGRHAVDRKRMAVRDSGKAAVTHYRIEERFKDHTRLRVKLETGRTHQIRVHMTHIHHPLVGDPVYGGRQRIPKGASEALISGLRGFGRQALHAARLTLDHPSTHEVLTWEAPLPDDYQALVELLRQEEG